jgi:sulfur carrier protein
MMQIFINGKAQTFADNIQNIADLVAQLGLVGKRIAVEQNGEIVPRSVYAQTNLQNGDKLEIVGAVGGG